MGLASSVRRRDVVCGERVDGIHDMRDRVCDDEEDFLVVRVNGRDGTRWPGDGMRAYCGRWPGTSVGCG